jgi:hypothetical protein
MKKIILKFIFSGIVLFLFLTTPLSKTLADDCTDNGGYCGEATSCDQLDSGIHNSACAAVVPDHVCCEPSDSSTPADTYSEGTGGFMLLKGHLVPCGRKTYDSETDNDETAECTLCHLFLLLKNIFDLVLSLVIIVSILFITIGGVIYIVSTGNSTLTGVAKNIIKKTLTGFALMLVGWLIVFTLLSFLSAGDEGMVGTGGKWYEFSCDESSISSLGTMTGIPDDTEYTFDPDIESQMSDASTPLQDLLDCMESKLPSEAKRISSISDSAGMTNCVTGSYSEDLCAHTEDSCHYGGTDCSGESYAVDFGNESYGSQIVEAAKTCNSDVYTLNEGDHIHISIGQINGCNCN